MPQRWREHWPIDQDGEETRDAKVQLLGNLTLTSGPLNSSLSNASWSSKRPALVQNSLLLLNQQITANEDWDEQAIDTRGAQLSGLVCQIWPRPDAAEEHSPDATTAAAEAPGVDLEAAAGDSEGGAQFDTRRWSALDRPQLREVAIGLARRSLEDAGYTVAGPFDQRSNILAADGGHVPLEIHVRTSRNFNYTFLTKANFQPADDRAALLVLLLDDDHPRLYLIPSRAWETPNGLLVDREYDDLASDPEWGLTLSADKLSLLERFRLGSAEHDERTDRLAAEGADLFADPLRRLGD